jgi:hypothetical protein
VLTKTEMMERLELIEFLREHLTVCVSTSVHYECSGQYLHSCVSISLDGEEITCDDDSTFIED